MIFIITFYHLLQTMVAFISEKKENSKNFIKNQKMRAKMTLEIIIFYISLSDIIAGELP